MPQFAAIVPDNPGSGLPCQAAFGPFDTQHEMHEYMKQLYVAPTNFRLVRWGYVMIELQK